MIRYYSDLCSHNCYYVQNVCIDVWVWKQLKVRNNWRIVKVHDRRELVVNHRFMQSIAFGRYASDWSSPRQTTKAQRYEFRSIIWDPLRVQWCEIYFSNLSKKTLLLCFCFAFQSLPFMKWIATQSNVNHIFGMNVEIFVLLYSVYLKYCLRAISITIQSDCI